MRPRGHVRQRPSGSWAAIVPIAPDPVTGRRRSKWLTAPTQEAAERLRKKAIAEIEAGRRLDFADVPLGDYLRDWLETWIKPRRRPRTVAIYAFAIEKHLVPALGRIPLSRLTPRHLEEYYHRQLQTLAPATVQLHHSILRTALRRAVRDEILERSPVERTEPPPPPRHCGKALPVSTLRRLLVALGAGSREQGVGSRTDEHAALSPSALLPTPYSLHPLLLPVLLAAVAGLRRGEALALTWDDVDLGSGRLEVRHSVSADGASGPPKTASSYRTVTLPPFVVHALVTEKAAQARNRLIAGTLWKGTGLVICRGDGSRVPARTLDRHWIAFRRGLGIPELAECRFHDLRHTAGTHAHRSGAPTKAVAGRLGHGSLATTEVYLHGQDEDDAAIAAWWEGRFGPYAPG